jgi:hypothetical protein
MELIHLKGTIVGNGYSNHEVMCVFAAKQSILEQLSNCWLLKKVSVPLCWLVGRSVGRSVGQSVGRSVGRSVHFPYMD